MDENDLIKRYDIPILDGMMIGDGDDPNGEWVRYDDHAAALADAQATIARLEAALRSIAENPQHGEKMMDVIKRKMHTARAALSPKTPDTPSP